MSRPRDQEAKKMHIFWSPDGDAYIDSLVVEMGGEIVSHTMNERVIDTSAIL